MPIYPYSFQLPPLSAQDIPNNGAVGEFLGISAGGVLDWLPVATGGGDMLKSENLSGLANYATARTNIGLGTTSTPTFANLTLTSPSLSSSAPVTISQTWNGTGSTVFKALVVNATTPGTTSSSSSLLLDLQVGGVSTASINKSGQFYAGSTAQLLSLIQSDAYIRNASSGRAASLWADECRIVGGPLVFSDSHNVNISTISAGVALYKEAANTLALRNGAAAQTFNVYGTYTSGTSYERLTLSAPSAANAIIGTNKGSGGGTARGLDLHTDGAARMTISTAGNVGIGTTAPGAKLQVVGNAIFGENVASSTINNVSFGGSYGTSTPGNKANLKWDMYNDGSGRYGIGMSVNLMEFQAGINGGFGFYPNNTTTSALHIIANGNLGIGTTAPGAKLTVITPFNNYPTDLNPVLSLRQSTDNTFGFDWIQDGSATGNLNLHRVNSSVSTHVLTVSRTTGNVGIGTTSPSEKLHVAGNSNPSVLIENTLATGYSQFLFKNTVTTGASFFLNGSTQTGYGGPSSFNIIASTGPIGFHTASVTNALSIAQSGAATFANNVFLGGFIQLSNADGRISFDGGNKVFSTAANTYIQDLYRRAGSGDPNGTVTAPVGATYNRTDGGAGTSFYVKESGTGNTGWVGK